MFVFVFDGDVRVESACVYAVRFCFVPVVFEGFCEQEGRPCDLGNPERV